MATWWSPALTDVHALRDAAPTAYWLDDVRRPEPLPALTAPTRADLVVVGGGYLGLWTALLAATREPGREVLLLEGQTCGHAPSGRNGGFCEASLTHGLGNGLARWPEEMPQLLDLGRRNLDAIEAAIGEHTIDCDFVRTGTLSVATADHQLADLREEQEAAAAVGHGLTLLGEEAVRARVASRTYRGALFDPDCALVEAARLAWGLRAACLAAGVRIAEHTAVLGLSRSGADLELATPAGAVIARQVVLATNAFRPLLRRLRLRADDRAADGRATALGGLGGPGGCL